MVPVRLVRVVSTGKLYLYLGEQGDKVRVRGDVLRVSGFSAVHGPDKVFQRSRIEMLPPIDLSEELLCQLRDQGTEATSAQGMTLAQASGAKE